MSIKDKRIHPPFWQHDYHVLTKLYSVIKESIKFVKNKNILIDYGCGDLPYKHLFMDNFKKYVAVDIGENQQADISVKENERIPIKDNSADLVLSTQVLEHVRDVDFYMKECQRLIKSGSFLLISTHGVWPYHEFPHDYNRWTRRGLEGLISKFGFKIVKTWPILTGFAVTLQFELLLFANIFHKWGMWGKIPLAVVVLVGNCLIYFLDLLFFDRHAFDASVFVILAQKK